MAPAQPTDIASFVTWVLDQDKNLEPIEVDVRAQLEVGYNKALEDQVNAAILARLSDDQATHLESIMDKFGPTEIQDYIRSQVPDIDDVVASILMRFRDNYLGA